MTKEYSVFHWREWESFEQTQQWATVLKKMLRKTWAQSKVKQTKRNTIVFPSFVSDTKSLGRTLSEANCLNSKWYACTLLYQWVPWQISNGCCQLNGEWGRDSTADWWTMTGAASLLVDGGGSCCKQSSTKKRCQFWEQPPGFIECSETLKAKNLRLFKGK